jgi:hypothetical protein
MFRCTSILKYQPQSTANWQIAASKYFFWKWDGGGQAEPPQAGPPSPSFKDLAATRTPRRVDCCRLRYFAGHTGLPRKAGAPTNLRCAQPW